ncbi:MAG: M61 family metallopeptidase [Bacteroidia bacterium]|nr:M61 family metallopeptidase [Bacteroidia bacterium]
MKYTISCKKPHTRFVDVELLIQNITTDTILVKLPNWRPGRYELGNFSKNVQRFSVFTLDAGNVMGYEKIDKSTWQIKTGGRNALIIKYNYYANQLDAGACFVSDEMLYFNPIHCCLYVPDKIDQQHTLFIDVPQNWKIATALFKYEGGYHAENYHQLVDSPVIASPTIQKQTYQSNGINFHIWVQGNYTPPWNKWLADFKKFTDFQIKSMQEIPVTEYHWLIHILNEKMHHGVEHLNSTVLAFGSADTMNNTEVYADFLSLASHELFHVWNVKTIKPVAFMPYNYEKENYSRSGYVYEGFTTYLGDMFLMRCGLYTESQFLDEINKNLNSHLNNPGRLNMSLADSSFDTWLDGYTPGIPNRKVNIYADGSLIAMVIDLLIVSNTKGGGRLETVFLALWQDYAKNNLGYTDKDVQLMCEAVSQVSMVDVFENYVFKASSYLDILIPTLLLAGYQITETKNNDLPASVFGFRLSSAVPNKLVSVMPQSPADDAMLSIGDEILQAYGEPVKANLNDLLLQHTNEVLPLVIKRNGKEKQVVLNKSNQTYYNLYKVERMQKTTAEQDLVRKNWLNI